MKTYIRILAFAALLLLAACRHEIVVPGEEHTFPDGLYILCEGNMGSNKATLDFYSFAEDTLYRNIYPAQNPSVVMELGDVGNDIAMYGSRLYAVINVSGKVEVMDRDARRIGQVNIPNCRYLCFDGAYCYVSSYAGPVQIDAHYSQRGYVAKVDTATLAVADTCHVGYQPNGIAIHKGKLYAANSGGYMAPNYDSTLSVIDLERFEEVERITVAPNLGEVCLDAAHEALFVTSIGDYVQPDQLYRVDLTTKEVKRMPLSAMKMCLMGDQLYCYSYSIDGSSYHVLNTGTLAVSTLAPEQAERIQTPYGIFVCPADSSFFVTDARDYVTPGALYHFSKEGALLSVFRTGDIPGHFALVPPRQ